MGKLPKKGLTFTVTAVSEELRTGQTILPWGISLVFMFQLSCVVVLVRKGV